MTFEAIYLSLEAQIIVINRSPLLLYIDPKRILLGTTFFSVFAVASGAAMSLPIVKAEVSTFFVDGDGLTYETNLFTIAVTVDGSLLHTVERSIVDFVELDRRLRKKFPRNEFAALPLEDITIIALKRALEKGMGASRNGTSSVGTSSPAAWSPASSRSGSFSTHSHSAVPPSSSAPAGSVHTTEELTWANNPMTVRQSDKMGATKIKAFNDYLGSLLSLHEVVVTEDLLQFLDDEVSSLSRQSIQEPLSVHDLLLLDEPVTNAVIRTGGHENAAFTMQPGQMIVWSFTTLNYDIAFSVEVNGVEKIHYTRVDSHRKPVCGALLIESQSLCVMKFDNSYARWHSKTLAYRARVCSFQEYHVAKEKALEVLRESKQFALRRTTLRRAVVRHAASLSGVIHSSSVLPEAAEQDEIRLRTLEVDCFKLQSEVTLCHRDLEQATDEIETLERELAALKGVASPGGSPARGGSSRGSGSGSRLFGDKDATESMRISHNSLSESWAFTLGELEASRAREFELQQKLEEERGISQSLRVQVLELQQKLKAETS